ncbi:hypothetical protein PYCC9005_005257 [Savitreella phatthalungensis]
MSGENKGNALSRLEELLEYDCNVFIDALLEQFKVGRNGRDDVMLQMRVPVCKARRFDSKIILTADLGGTWLRTARHSWLVPDHYRCGHAEVLFDWIVARLSEHISRQQEVLVALAFSYPMRQADALDGLIVDMGKGYALNFVGSGKSIAGLFNDACVRLGSSLRLAAVVNDSIVALLDPVKHPAISLVMGTGCNCSFSDFCNEGQVIATNVELSLFGRGIMPATSFDRSLDLESSRPGFQTFEQFVACRHLVRLSQLALVAAGLNSEAIALNVDTFVQHIAHQTDIVANVCMLFARRAARILAAAMLCVHDLQGNESGAIIACSGSFFGRSQRFLQLCQEELDALYTHRGRSNAPRYEFRSEQELHRGLESLAAAVS